MKKVGVVAFVVFFALSMFHYFYAEDHCPAHDLPNSGAFGHVHQQHGGASVCLCFWSSLFGPEVDDFARATDFRFLRATAEAARLRAPLGADIAHPPKSSLV